MAQEIIIPNHIAIVPDGNRRWAEKHGVPKIQGHRTGAKTMLKVVDYLLHYQVKYLTFWGFSVDNWKRSDKEITDLFQLLATCIKKDAPWLNRNGVRLRCIGRLNDLPPFLQSAINDAVQLTSGNTGMTLTLAFNYTGRTEIVDAVRRLVDDNAPSPKIDEHLFSRYLYDGLPDVDLVIRTAGEFRLSNFLLWQTAYSELYFTEALWPDFDTEDIEEALLAYNKRQRRFGGD